MIAVLSAGGFAMLVSLLGTPLFIRFLVKREYGQFIRQDGPTAHFTKRGTPTMGGVVIIAATLIGYALANVVAGRPPNASGLLLLFLMVGLGVIGFLADSLNISRQPSLRRRPPWHSLGH